jgi:FkbM family methyltransferase
MIADRRWLDDRSREIAVYRSVLNELREGDLIFDIGANDGFKTDVFLRLGARVVAVDPDSVSKGVLVERFLRYRLSPKPVVIVGKAVSDKITTETLWLDEPGSAVNTLSQKWVGTLRSDKARFAGTHSSLKFSGTRAVETTTIEELISAHGQPFYIKIDVEGYEANVLRGLQRPVPFLSFEVNLPEFRPEALECVYALEQLAIDGKYNYIADIKQGLVMEEWLEAREFRAVLERCGQGTIEVFWSTIGANCRAVRSKQEADVISSLQRDS